MYINLSSIVYQHNTASYNTAV